MIVERIAGKDYTTLHATADNAETLPLGEAAPRVSVSGYQGESADVT
jgi:hypothetical protein